jgi:hypothetical protein
MWRTCVSDVLLFGPPLELLALTFGFYWKAAYEHFAWLSVTDGSRGA